MIFQSLVYLAFLSGTKLCALQLGSAVEYVLKPSDDFDRYGCLLLISSDLSPGALSFSVLICGSNAFR